MNTLILTTPSYPCFTPLASMDHLVMLKKTDIERLQQRRTRTGQYGRGAAAAAAAAAATAL